MSWVAPIAQAAFWTTFVLVLLRLTPRGMTGAVSAAVPVRRGRGDAAASLSLTSSGGGAGRGLGLSAPLPVHSYVAYREALARVHHQIVTGPRRVPARRRL